MTSLEFAGDSGSLSDINASQGEFRGQIAALTDMMKQIVGNAAVFPGTDGQADPLNAPFTLYVNPYTGSDEFVGGAYNEYEAGATDEEIIASKLKRLEKQRLTCGYTPQRPFKTINRAVIEAAIITSKDWYTYTDPRAHVDCVSIVLSTGVHTLYNDPGQASTSITSWGLSKDPTTEALIKFNPATVGGVLLPRGCSLCGPDLRKTTIRPNWVPATSDEAADYSNRRGMLKITGTGYFFGFTLMDKIGEARSHHLLDGFHFASKAELDDFYAKVLSAVGSGADLAAALAVTRGTEYQIVGPIDRTQAPTAAWDTTASASPYIFNCSVRSDYGMGGAFMDGSKVQGLKSMVCANFTGVSLQKDMSCWQIYSGGSWVTPTYEQYISTDPDSVRMKPARLSRHISAIRDAFIQEVSVFAIGQGIHHFTDLGGEITVTNSNSSFGGCAAYSKGYKTTAFPSDRNWSISGIKVPLDLQYKTGNIRYIYLGTIQSATASKITLTSELAADAASATVPAILLQDGYSLASGTYIWAENPFGDPWYAPLSSSAWNASSANEIKITAAFAGTDPTTQDDIDQLIGKRIYLRRLVDTRTPDERRVMLLANNTASARLPQRNFILQTNPDRTNGAISRELTTTGPEIFIVSNSGAGTETGFPTSAEFTIRRAAPSEVYASGNFYPSGAVVRHAFKHYVATQDIYATTSTPNLDVWLETYVHTASDYNAEDPIIEEARTISIDTDTDTDAYSTGLGISWSSVWADDEYRSSTDYKGVHAFLVALGLTSNQAHAALVPQAENGRLLDPANPVDFPNAPSGGAATGRGNWAIEFRRPSMLRLYGHAWEWAGFLNYSKAVPAAQQDLGAQNAFTYYFTSENGGRVVPQGSNENGFNITPRGLEDIETGSTLTVSSIGTSSIELAEKTSFENLEVTDTMTVENLVVNGKIEKGLPDIEAAKTDSLGGVYYAQLADYRAGLAATSNNQVNAPGNNNAVNVVGLEYWKSYNRFISAREGIQYVYVDPVNGRDANVAQLLEEPPTSNLSWDGSSWSSSKNQPAKSLVKAVGYINATYSANETVELRLGPGYYLETGNLSLTCKVRVRSWDYTARTYLCGDEDNGTQPFMDQQDAGGERGKAWNQTRAYLTDGTKHPIFLVRPSVVYGYSPSRAFYQFRPLRFIFEQEATVIGIVWLSAVEALVNANVPDSFFSVNTGVDLSAIRAAATSDPDNALNYFIKAEMDKKLETETSATWDYLFGLSCIEARAELDVINCAFDAVAPSSQFNNTTRIDSVIGISDKQSTFRGIWIIGNARISSDLAGAPVYQGQSSYTLTGHHESFIAAVSKNEASPTTSISLGGTRETSGGTGADADYNYTWNNIHVVNNALAYRDGWNPTTPPSTTAYLDEDPTVGSNWKLIGPGFLGFLAGTPGFGQFGLFWHAGFLVSDNHWQGVAGIFGSVSLLDGTVRRTRGTAGIPAGFTATVWRRPYFLRRAGTISAPDVSVGIPSNPGEVGALEDFDPLNIELFPIKKGIDVIEAVTLSRDVKI